MSLLALLKSILVSWAITQPAILLLLGLLSPGKGLAERLAAVLALPMSIAFFGLPALWACLIWIVPSVTVLHLLGLARFAPLLLSAGSVAFAVFSWQTKADDGYEMGVRLTFVACVIVWAAYTQFWSAPWAAKP